MQSLWRGSTANKRERGITIVSEQAAMLQVPLKKGGQVDLSGPLARYVAAEYSQEDADKHAPDFSTLQSMRNTAVAANAHHAAALNPLRRCDHDPRTNPRTTAPFAAPSAPFPCRGNPNLGDAETTPLIHSVSLYRYATQLALVEPRLPISDAEVRGAACRTSFEQNPPPLPRRAAPVTCYRFLLSHAHLLVLLHVRQLNAILAVSVAHDPPRSRSTSLGMMLSARRRTLVSFASPEHARS